MTEFNKEHALITYQVLVAMRDDELNARPDFRARREPRGSKGLHTDLDLELCRLEAEVKRHSCFFWHHFEDEECGGGKSVCTLEEIQPTGSFDTERAETHFNTIVRTPLNTFTEDVINELEEIALEAQRNGFEMKRENDTRRFVCKPMLEALER